MAVIRVVLADDHTIWLSGLTLELGANFDVVGTATNAKEAIELVIATAPDLVVCDLHMPDGGGLAVARSCSNSTKVVILTVSEDEGDLLEAVAAGAMGYLLKATPAGELRSNLESAVRGDAVFSPHLASLVLTEFRRLAKVKRDPSSLSEREREVLQLVARGHKYREIGESLFISERTVENHVRNILEKLHLSRRQELVRFALEHGLE